MRTDGWAEDGFGKVADAFAGVLAGQGDGGAAVAVFLGGRPVVDLWGGVADVTTGRAWERETATVVWSCAKGLVSLLVHRLAQEGRIDLDAPVAAYWPEFAQGGKETVTVRTVLAHRAGLPLVDAGLSFEDVLAWEPVVTALAAQEPLWEPGREYAYHGQTFGWLAGELIRRVTGLTPGGYFRELLGDPLGLETWIGLPPGETGRLARLIGPAEPSRLPELFSRMLTVDGAIDFPGIDSPRGYNSPALLAAELPGSNAVSTARGLAGAYAAAATGLDGGPRLLDEATVTDALRLRSSGPMWPDGLDMGAGWGTGFTTSAATAWSTLGPRTFGHDGAGGNSAYGDDEYGIGFALVTNRMVGPGDDRAQRLSGALRDCLG
ncbi:serine hydrolase domain-containing protein [Streptomyces gamaensis]|uniref:Serine hydrolase domain-containing protein n=1 Tax=Streptomyces gamaensis TaxID=1763542 RepID=A0ABW0Z022_9ACTN